MAYTYIPSLFLETYFLGSDTFVNDSHFFIFDFSVLKLTQNISNIFISNTRNDFEKHC